MKRNKVLNSIYSSKKIILSYFIIFLSIISTGIVKGQIRTLFGPPGEVDYSLGFHGGIGMNGLDFYNIAPLPGPNATNHLQPNISLGFFGEFRLFPMFYYGGEVNFTTRPGKILFKGGSYEWSNKYVEVPIMIKYEVLPNLKVYAGPEIGALINAKIRRIQNSPLPFLDSTTNLYSHYNPIIISGVLGANYEITSDFAIDIRLTKGLMNMAKPDNPYNGLKIKALEFSIYYNLPLGNKSVEFLRF